MYAAASYYLKLDDAMSDLRSPDGFKDDLRVVDAVAAALNGRGDFAPQ